MNKVCPHCNKSLTQAVVRIPASVSFLSKFNRDNTLVRTKEVVLEVNTDYLDNRDGQIGKIAKLECPMCGHVSDFSKFVERETCYTCNTFEEVFLCEAIGHSLCVSCYHRLMATRCKTCPFSAKCLLYKKEGKE